MREVFTIVGMRRLGNIIHTEFGDGEPVLIEIEHPTKGGTYCAFGQALTSQASSLTPNDFPARVAMVEVPNRGGTQKYKVLVTFEELQASKTDEDIPF